MAESDQNPTPASPEDTAIEASADQEATDTATAEDRLEQKVTVEDIGPARKKLLIEIPESRISQGVGDSFDRLRTDAAVPGFRRGRAPRRLLEKRFGGDVRKDVRGQLISESYSQAIEDEKLRVLGDPDVKDIEQIELPESGPLTIEIEIEVAPEVKLPDFDTIEVEKEIIAVTDEDVEKEVERYRERFGRMTDRPDGKVKAEDYLEGPVRVLAEGEEEPVMEMEQAHVYVPGKERDYKGHVAGIVIGDLGKQIKGKQVGDTLTIAMTGPTSHENERIREKPITIEFTIRQIQRVEPADDQTLALHFGAENLEEVYKTVREMLDNRAQREQAARLHEQITDKLAELVDLALPEGITGRQTERALRRKKMELLYRGVEADEVEQRVAEMRAESEEESIQELKQFFILDAAAEQLEIQVDERELNGRLHMLAMQQGRRPEKLRQEMTKRGELENLYLQIREQKTLDAILEKVKVREVQSQKEDQEAESAAAADDETAGKKKTSKKKSSKEKAAEKKSEQ